MLRNLTALGSRKMQKKKKKETRQYSFDFKERIRELFEGSLRKHDSLLEYHFQLRQQERSGQHASYLKSVIFEL
jgi:hypothetical protein